MQIKNTWHTWNRAQSVVWFLHVCHGVGHWSLKKYSMTTKDVVTGRCLRNPCMSCMWALKVSQKFHDIHVRGSIKVKIIVLHHCTFHLVLSTVCISPSAAFLQPFSKTPRHMQFIVPYALLQSLLATLTTWFSSPAVSSVHAPASTTFIHRSTLFYFR